MSDTLDKRFTVQVFQHGEIAQREDFLAQEQPVAIQVNGVSQAVMMATPTELESFAVGFCMSEGIVVNREEIYSIDLIISDQGIILELDIATRRQQQLAERRRHMAGRSGCGLCGIDSLDALRTCAVPLTATFQCDHDVVQRALESFNAIEPDMLRSGSLHQASWVSRGGVLMHSCFDVGRHNALDKLIGWRAGNDIDEGFVMLSSRASHELVEKCATVGIGMLVCVSGATSLAVERARELQLTLVGFAREGRHVLYSNPG